MTEPPPAPLARRPTEYGLTPVGIEKMLDDGQETQLIGASETEHLDFKSAPYVLSKEKERWELAKDIAALANSGGGCLVIGVATRAPVDREDEVASEIKPFPRRLVNIKQYRDAIGATASVYPMLRDLKFRTFARPSDAALMLIAVPEQHPDAQPFLVVRMVEGDEKRGIGIGVPLRSGPHTYWETPGQLHRDLSDGQRARRELPSAPKQAVVPPAVSTPVGEVTDRRLAEIEQYMGWGEAPTLLLAAIPRREQAVPIDGFYAPSGIAGCVTSPPEIRDAGFGLAWAKPRNVDGSLVNTSAKRSILWADPNGACFAAAAGNPSFLTRSGGTGTVVIPQPRRINPTVIVEWTYVFCLFVKQCVADSVEGDWTIATRLRGARDRDWPLRLGPGLALDFWTDGNDAGIDDWYFEMVGDLDPGDDAYRLLTAIYRLFGLDQEAIPYTAQEKVEPELIRAIR